MEGKIKAKSQYGIQVEGNEGWLNYGNYYKGSKDFGIGDQVKVEANGKFLVNVTVTSKATPATGAGGPVSPRGFSTEMARSVAVKAVFGSDIFGDLDYSQAVSYAKTLIPEVTNYILMGKFDAKIPQTEVEETH